MSTPPTGNQPSDPTYPAATPPRQAPSPNAPYPGAPSPNAPSPNAPRQDDLLRKPAGPGGQASPPGQAPAPRHASPPGGPAQGGPAQGGPAQGGPAQGGPAGSPSAGGQQTDVGQAFQKPAGFDDRGRVKRGRVSAAWVGSIAAAIVLILLIIFIAQNLNRASLHFLGLSGHMPLGLMLLIAAVAGVLLVAVPGSIRILQLRRALKANTPREQRVPDTGGAPR